MRATLRGFAIGIAGATLCWLIGFPAPWLAGSMIAAVGAVLAGVDIAMPNALRVASFILLGVQTGASINRDTVARVAQWPLSLLLLAVTVLAVIVAGTLFYRRLRGWDTVTALFASLPGALGLVVLLAAEARADMRRVTIAQSIRLFLLIAALPLLVSSISPPEALMQPAVISDPLQLILLLAAAAIAGLGLERLRIPAGLILGPILAGAALELTGMVHGAAPLWLLVPANLILGILVAVRFKGYALADLAASLGEGLAGFVLALAISAAGAGVASVAARLPLALTLLAFAPGGLDAMLILAFALDLDPAYVGAHQIARYIGLALTMPWVTAWLVRHPGRAAE
jgi:uncharacterized protein